MRSNNGTLTTAGDTVSLEKDRNCETAQVQISGTYGTAVLAFEATFDGTIWVPIAAARMDTMVIVAGGSNLSPSDDATILLQVPSVGCGSVRVRLVSIVSGSIAVTIFSLAGSKPFIIHASSSQDNTVTGSLVADTSVADTVSAGSSGNAGTLQVFPATASKGKLSVAVADQTGDTTVTLQVAEMAAARTISLVDPLGAADLLAGVSVARTATADGLTTGTIAPAGVIQFVAVTSASANNIVVLPTSGKIVILSVGANGYELRSETPASIAINGGSGANAESAIPANCTVIAVRESATAWKALQIASDGTTAGVEAAA